MNVKLSNSQLSKLKSGIKMVLTLNFSTNVMGDSNDETNFPHKLLLVTDRQVSRLFKASANKSSANIKLSKTQLSKVVQSGGFPGVFYPSWNVGIVSSLASQELANSEFLTVRNSEFLSEFTWKRIRKWCYSYIEKTLKSFL